MVRRAPAARQGFTLIELLIVMVVIAILAALVIAGIGLVRERAEVARTATIIATLQLACTENGTADPPQPIPHPLAATAAATDSPFAAGALPRALFYREGTELDTEQAALWVRDPTWLPATEHDRLLQDGDRLAGYLVAGDVPGLFGLRRDALGIIGLAADWMVQERRLPAPRGPYLGSDGKLKQDADGDYGSAVYPDGEFLRVPPYRGEATFEERQTADLTRMISSQASKLADLKAIASSPKADTSQWVTAEDPPLGKIDVQQPVAGSYDPHHRVWIGEAQSSWRAGDPSLQIDGSWHRYRIRGAHLVDAWGHPLLMASSPDGDLLIYSAGPDGCFLVDPGDNKQIDTDPSSFAPTDATSLGGDDRQATDDNIQAPMTW